MNANGVIGSVSSLHFQGEFSEGPGKGSGAGQLAYLSRGVKDLKGAMAMVGSFLIFFTVFYCNQCYGRFYKQYHSSMSAEGRILDAATRLRSFLGPGNPYTAQIVRYMNAAHLAAYVGLNSEGYDEDFWHRRWHDDKLRAGTGRTCAMELPLQPTSAGLF